MTAIRLRHLVKVGPRPSIAHLPARDAEVTFAPMDALADGLGSLDTSLTRSISEVASGSYNFFADGDLLLAKVTPCFENGKKALVKGLTNGIGFATSEVHVIRPDPRRINPRYLFYVLSSEDFRASGMASMTGAGGLRRVSEAAILNYRPQVVDVPAQKAIADFLNLETARIDRLIEKKKQFLSLASLRIEALVAAAISDSDVPRIRFGHAVHRVQRPVRLSDHEELVRLGLFNRGRGIFKKPASDEEGMGDSSFFFVHSGDLILSGQFAWEGAVALASVEEEGCVVSHRYPIYRGRTGVNTAYLLGLLRSSFGDFLLNDASRGSAGRNRPLNTKRLEKEKIPIASQELQTEVERAILFERRLKILTERSVELLKTFRTSLITSAVAGRIDVESWGKRGETDRRLDRIQEAMSA